MTQSNQFLIVSRLIITSRTRVVYDQEFFNGVNVIRGDNGTGKSTVMDLLFFVLGGDIKEWTEEQSRCDFVMCEIKVPGRLLTIKREIASPNSMYIYEGALDLNAAAAQFLVLPYRVTERRESFSQVLFDFIGLPRYIKDDSVTLTMHQILRLIYVDQITPPNKILRQEASNFDGYSNRLAIGEYLLGIDDLSSHILRQEKNKLEKEGEAIEAERRAIFKVLGRHSVNVDEDSLIDEIQELNREKGDLQSGARTMSQEPSSADVIVAVQKMASHVASEKADLLQLEEDRVSVATEVVENELFIDSLEFRLRSILEASEVNEELGSMDFKFCPSCLTPLNSSAEHGTCRLCKTAKAFDLRGRGYLAERTSLQFQLAESKEILTKRRAELLEIGKKILQSSTSVELSISQYIPMGIRLDDPRYYADAMRLGFIEKQLEQLAENLMIVREIDASAQKLGDINRKIDRIAELLVAAVEQTAGRRSEVAENISELVVKILKHDLGYETAFTDASHFDFDFGRDAMRLDGKSKFSASSMTLLKNAFRFAIFYLSVVDENMRYPRLLIMDNIEDKGMVPERSQAFQRTIVDCCSDLSGEYQLIFATSMIDPDLDNTEICRGPRYAIGQHTLAL